ncbi:hypothetical protein D3C80_2070830 [compost metagenome]
MPFGNLGRASVATAIMGNDPVTVGEEEQHLRVPIVRRQGPAVMEDDRLGILRAPVLVKDFSAVFSCYEAHVDISL